MGKADRLICLRFFEFTVHIFVQLLKEFAHLQSTMLDIVYDILSFFANFVSSGKKMQLTCCR